MGDVSEVLEISRNRSLRLGLLLASTLAIVIISALVYAGAVFQKALIVGSGNGVVGPGTTTSIGISVTLTMVIFAGQVFIITLALLGFPPRLPKLLSRTSQPGNTSSLITASKSVKKEEWEESRGSKGSEKANPDIVGDILESLRKKNAATN